MSASGNSCKHKILFEYCDICLLENKIEELGASGDSLAKEVEILFRLWGPVQYEGPLTPLQNQMCELAGALFAYREARGQ